jgi:hypothetical protein
MREIRNSNNELRNRTKEKSDHLIQPPASSTKSETRDPGLKEARHCPVYPGNPSQEKTWITRTSRVMQKVELWLVF